ITCSLNETWYSFFVFRRQESMSPECPHRLSDKLLKSSAAALFSAARGVHITLSRFRVKRLFSLFSVRFWSEPR
ncbi:hypothetical protein CJH69_19665, partial [Salmonella enterica]|nr:hypothetical protein [Salmonella enterica]